MAAGATVREMRDSDATGMPVTLCELRTDTLALVISFLNVPALAVACTPNRHLCEIAGSHEHWRWFVLQFFGVYYDDYMRSVEVCDVFKWRRLFVYVRRVHRNVDKKRGVTWTLPQLLRPCVQLSEGGGRRRRQYRGSLQLAGNCNVFFWENGRVVQVVRAKDGQVLREIDTGQTFRRHFHRLANVRERLFVCLNDCIKVWEYGPNDVHKPPVRLPAPRRPPGQAGRPLELLVHRRRLILLESACCLMWDTDTLEFVCCIRHCDTKPGFVQDVSSGTLVQDGPQAYLHNSERGAGNDARALEVQWMGELIVTWVRSASRSLNVWTLAGERQAHLAMESTLVQVDVARVTWISVDTLDHFILCALDARSIISLWDSKQNFSPVFRFYCGCKEPFDLVLTQDFMAVVNDNVAENRLDICFWKLWLHPNFETPTDETAEPSRDTVEAAAKQRQATVQEGGSPAGARFFSLAGAGFAGTAAAHLAQKALQHFLHRELRPNARPIKRFSIQDIDSYFASYRNFLNVCSFHKSGQESLSVYRSSSLQKKVFFPPARHTKFEEWLALQVHDDGHVVLHDFRPDQLAFDELPTDRWPGTGNAEMHSQSLLNRPGKSASATEPRTELPMPGPRQRPLGHRRARRVG